MPDNRLDIAPLPPASDIAALLGRSAPVPGRGVVRATAALARAMRQRGVWVGLGSVMDALKAAALVGPENEADLRQALAANLTASHHELELFNVLFDRLFLGRETAENDLPPPVDRRGALSLALTGDEGRDGPRPKMSPYSPAEVLARTDLSKLADPEAAEAIRLLTARLADLLSRPSRRRRPGRGRERIDFRRTFRRSLSYGGEPLELVASRRRERPLRLVLLLDVSGSMDVQARFMVAFAKAWLTARPDKVEVFAFSTRLTRLTRLLADRPLAAALEEIGRLMPEWSGGTRIGASLRELLTGSGRGLVSSSSVVAVFSDGWDRGDIPLLEREMAHLARRARRVVWLNPLMGHPEYEPTCAGMQAALPFVERLIPAHSVRALVRAGRIIEEALV